MRSLFLVGLLLCGFGVQAQNEPIVPISAPIEAVKIHLQGAEVIHKTRAELSGGRQKLVFTGLSPKLYEKTIQFAASGGVKILSVSSETNFLNRREDSPRIKQLRDSSELTRKQIAQIKDEQDAYQQEKQLLLQNRDIKGQNNNLSLEELAKAGDFFRQRILNINQNLTKLDERLEEANKRLFDLRLQMYELNAAQVPLAEVHLVVETDKAVSSNLELKYIVGDAGWSAIYDLESSDVSKPIGLRYRALAYNNTGVDWKNVKLMLSTADPLQSATQPTLAVWDLSNYSGYNLDQNNRYKGESNFNTGGYLSNAYNGQAVNKPTFQDSKRNLDEQYRQQVFREQNEAADINQIKQIMGDDFDAKAEYDPERLRRFNAGKTKPDVNFTTIDVPELNAEFDIARPYTIPSDKKPYSIDIKSLTLKADYRYLAVPKLDLDVFLVARLTDWEELDLISGNVNIYNGDRYIGQSYLDLNSLSDTLYVSLGRDPNITVSRTKIKGATKRQLLGSSKRFSLAYEIQVRNNRNAPIDIEIQDQLPISNDKDVTVSSDELSGGEYDPKTGFVVWKTAIGATETKQFNIGFSVKYPAEKVIRLEFSRSRKMGAPTF